MSMIYYLRMADDREIERLVRLPHTIRGYLNYGAPAGSQARGWVAKLLGKPTPRSAEPIVQNLDAEST